MTAHWAITASAAEFDATERETIRRELEDWLGAGGDGVLLATCHRVELYGVGPAPEAALTARLTGDHATTHLLRVACGLESVIVGEDEVLNQVRQAMQHSVAGRGVDRRLHRLFQVAIATGRRARSGRTSSSGDLAQSAVRWLQTKANISGRMVLVGGAGRMGATLAHSLTRSGASVVLCSRDASRASRLARLYGAKGLDLRAGAELVAEAAAVAVALGGPWSELQPAPGMILPPIADISAPQAVPDSVRGRLNGNFLGIDDLYRQTQPLPGAYIKDAEGLVAAAAADFAAWLERPR